jgi:drug/metabolite transporter (DMT)-like permease
MGTSLAIHSIDPIVLPAVLAAAALHAGWNAVVKARLEPILAMTLVVIACGIAATPLLIVVGPPRGAALPYVGMSVVIHLGYYLVLAEAYRRGEMGQIYPIARGGAPLITALAAFVIVGEALGTRALIGVVTLGSGILLLAFHRRRFDTPADPMAIVFAAATALIIACYTVVDGLGARVAGDAVSYAAALFVVDAVPLPLLILIRRGPAAFAAMRRYIPQGFLGGIMSLMAYCIAIWAMTRAPIPVVAALRETSVLFSAILATVVLKETFAPIRGVAAVVIFAGIVLIRWQ